MTVFAEYSRFYDLLYRDKDYAAEARFVDGLLARHRIPGGPLRVLELGSGTGRHARLLAEQGHRVRGIDRSPEMVARARAELADAPPEIRARLSLDEADLRTYRAGEPFEAVVCLFHVMSYQTTQADLEAALATARAHLAPGGLFLFDAWYGPGVLTTPPSIRTKRVAGPGYSVLRLSEPTLLASENRVDVRFTVFALSGNGAVESVTEETHRMRYWFHPEIVEAAGRAGFEVAELAEWMTGRAPDTASWNACWVLRVPA